MSMYRREIERTHLQQWEADDGKPIPRPAKVTLRFGATQQEATPEEFVRVYMLLKDQEPEAFEDMRLLAIFYPDGLKQDLFHTFLMFPDDERLILHSTTEDYKAMLSGPR